MTSPLIFTLDLEDHHGVYAPDGRYVDMTGRILDFLAALRVRGTFFTVGRVAQAAPSLVRRVVAEGHELACHSLDHTPLEQETPERFREKTEAAKKILEDVSGQSVRGYRAPIFSLTRKTAWAVPLLQDMGFDYSSSVMPAPSPLYGIADAPRAPFRWACGLAEFPCPVARVGGLRFPYLGGFYLRCLPVAFHDLLDRTLDQETVKWTYIHPYDFDAGEPFHWMPNTSRLISLLSWFNRGRTFEKMKSILGAANAGTLCLQDMLSKMDADIPVFDPALPAVA